MDTPATLPALLRAAAKRYADRPALQETGDRSRSCSFTQLHDRVRSAAAGLAALGLNPGDRACIWAPNSVEWVIGALAISYAGGVIVPANSRYTGPEVADLVDRSAAVIVLVADGFLERTQIADLRAASSLPTVQAVVSLTPSKAADVVAFTDLPDVGGSVSDREIDDRADAISPDDVADILFTSGTTGRPKGAMTAHRQTVGVAREWARLGGVGSADRYLVIAPFFHTFGYKAGIVVGLITGACLYPMTVFDPDAMMALIQSERISVLPGAPTIYQSLLAAPTRSSYDLSSLRLAVTGAAIVPVVLIERMRAPSPEGLGIDQVVTAFGMTEAVVATMCRPDDPAALVATTSGRAVRGMEARVAEIGSNTALPAGIEGELLLRGDFVMLGYLDDAAATATAIDPDGWLHTGDIGRLDESGNLTITDRLKDVYICGGFNVYPAEIEQSLLLLEGVGDVAVVGFADERMGEVGRAYVVRAGDADGAALTEEAVTAFARERLANFKVPREIVFVDALPRNLGGKVLKNELRSRS